MEELLVQIIMYFMKRAAKSGEPRVVARAQDAARQKTLAAQRAGAMHKVLTAQQARTRPPLARAAPRALRPTAPKMPPTWSQPLPKWAGAPAGPVPRQTPAIVPSDAPKRPGRTGWQVPFLLGEILAPPLALREPE